MTGKDDTPPNEKKNCCHYNDYISKTDQKITWPQQRVEEKSKTKNGRREEG